MRKPRLFLTLVLSSIVLFVATAAIAAPRSRSRRLVVPARGTIVSGQVVDASSGAGVDGAIITIGERSVTAGHNGAFTFTNVPVGTVNLTVERWGYEALTRSMTVIAGQNVVTIAMIPRPVVKVRLRTALNVILDADSTDFMSLMPFSSYTRIAELTICTGGTETVVIREEEIKTVDNIVTIIDRACCADSSVTYAEFKLRDGRTIRGSMKDCLYYSVNLVGRNRETGVATGIAMSNISKIEFP